MGSSWARTDMTTSSFFCEYLPILSIKSLICHKGKSMTLLDERHCYLFSSSLKHQGLFLDVFLATQLNWSWRFLSFFGFCLEFFLVFPWVLSFFTKSSMSFCLISLNYWICKIWLHVLLWSLSNFCKIWLRYLCYG